MRFTSFDRVISVEPGSDDTRFIEAQLAIAAREALRSAITTGEGTRAYIRAVNNRLNVPEESVVAPGDIVYSFSWLREATVRAKQLLIAHSPVRTGRYRRSFITVADGIEVDPLALQHQRRVELVNTQPYSRKIQVGSKGFLTYRGLYDIVARRVRSEYPSVLLVRATFVRLSNGYVLKIGSGKRPDRRAGAEMNYPAILLVNQTTGFH